MITSSPVWIVAFADERVGLGVEAFSEEERARQFANMKGAKVVRQSFIDRANRNLASLHEFAEAVRENLINRRIDVRGVSEALQIVAVVVPDRVGVVFAINAELANGQRFRMIVEEIPAS